jgi:hypothetical protein
MTEHDNTDVWTALAIGAVVGIGATLLLRAQQDDASDFVKSLRPMKRAGKKMMKAAGKRVIRGVHTARSSGEDWMSAGRDALDDLQANARDIVHETRSELRKVARETVREAQRAARRARR